MAEVDIDPNKMVGAVVEKTLDSELAKNLFGPLTQSIGVALGLIGDIARFYTEENLTKICHKWASQRGDGKPLTPDDFKRVLPLLRDAAMQT